MKLLFKERFFSWLDSYDVFDENGNTVYSVEGQLSWGHCLHIHDAHGTHVATLKERVLTFLPKFELYLGDEREYLGCIQKEFTLFKPAFDIDFNGWHIDGDFWEWDYQILDASGRLIATVTKELFNWTDTYSIDVENPEDALYALMLVLAIDAEKCSRNNH